ncbi:MAG: STAS domain-containing protein [Zoogloeaceae bacterium]|jgi:phospholipid transport system transporter-binding protein|nr:STAS domain-containing protein [Zoogloeaceae bacterium]
MIECAEGRLKISVPMVMDHARKLLEAGREYLEAGALTIDLAGVTEVDSSGLAVLLEWQRAARGRLAVTGAPEGLTALARLYNLDGLLDLSPR